jgi:hypothetical protein
MLLYVERAPEAEQEMRQAREFYVLGLIDHTHPTATQLLKD